MACLATKGRALPCKSLIGGIKAIYFANFGDLGAITYDATDTDMITDFGDSFSVYKYELANNVASLTNTANVSEENGTTFFTQTLEVPLRGLTKEDHKELKLLAHGRPHVFVLDNNDNLFLVGLENGSTVVPTSATGTAKGDASGYTLSITAEEKLPANFLEATSGSGATGYPFDNLNATSLNTITIVTS